MTTPSDPVALLRSRSYLGAAGACRDHRRSRLGGGLLLSRAGQPSCRDGSSPTCPRALGFHAEPLWWPLLPLAAGRGAGRPRPSGTCPARAATHRPTGSRRAKGRPPPVELPGIVLAALATLSLGVVLGPEAPLIAIGSGLGVLAVHLVAEGAPPMAAAVIGAAGSFAAISTLLGSPILGAFLLMEAAYGLGGPMLGGDARPRPARRRHRLVDLHRPRATGRATAPSRLPSPQHPALREHPTLAGSSSGRSRSGGRRRGRRHGIRCLALSSGPTSNSGCLDAGRRPGGRGTGDRLRQGTGKSASDVLFSGQSALGPLITHGGE